MSDSDAEVQPAPSPNEVAWGRRLTACKSENATKVISADYPLAEHEVNLKALDKILATAIAYLLYKGKILTFDRKVLETRLFYQNSRN